jgi:hypothetical protein
MKKIIASFLATIIGTFGIVCIDQEARDMIVANSQKIDGYYSEYKEDMSQIEDSITECTHICKSYDEDISSLNSKIDNIEFPECSCKDYSHLERQYNELSEKYEELSLTYEENKPKEYKVGDIVEIPVYCFDEKINTLKCYLTILEIDEFSINNKYKVEVNFSGYFYTKNGGEYAGSTSYIIAIKADLKEIRYKQSETVKMDGSPYYMDNFILTPFTLNSLVLENNAIFLDIY